MQKDPRLHANTGGMSVALHFPPVLVHFHSPASLVRTVTRVRLVSGSYRWIKGTATLYALLSIYKRGVDECER